MAVLGHADMNFFQIAVLGHAAMTFFQKIKKNCFHIYDFVMAVLGHHTKQAA